MSRRRKRHTPQQIVRKLRDADAMLAAGRHPAGVAELFTSRLAVARQNNAERSGERELPITRVLES